MKPKILFWDIETSPQIGTTWVNWDAQVLDVLKDSELLCYSYKEPKSSKIGCDRSSRFDYTKPSDEQVVRKLHKVLSGVDMIIHHNGDAFDMKKANNRFLFYGLDPLPVIPSVDTKKVAKKYFGFNSNSLQDLARYLGLGSKLKHTGYSMWKGCMNNDKKSWDLMVKYNKQDVVLLEKVYDKMRPHIKNHPDLSLLDKSLDNNMVCSCGSQNFQKRGHRITKVNRIQRFQCQDCGSWK
jgi:uncharacterized protein YprB with RNaseH-like and TPR domain